jgi:hypothetical protein
MGWGKVLGLVFILFVILLLTIYWFVPTNIKFVTGNYNTNFSLNNNSDLTAMQFYPNMRFPDSSITYKISSDCPSDKSSDMLTAFQELSDITNLTFHAVDSNEEVSITCSNQVVQEGGLFTAGEGGPTKVIAGDKFNVIFSGEILLLRPSGCEKPQIAAHELLHVLGFKHSLNEYNIMYNVTNCLQTIGEDIPVLLNELYSYPSLPDLAFENASAQMHGRYLDVNMSVVNEGLADSQPATVDIYADGNLLKEFSLDGIKIGEGTIISFSNIFVAQISVSQLELVVNYNYNELEKNNNNLTLEIKK